MDKIVFRIVNRCPVVIATLCPFPGHPAGAEEVLKSPKSSKPKAKRQKPPSPQSSDDSSDERHLAEFAGRWKGVHSKLGVFSAADADALRKALADDFNANAKPKVRPPSPETSEDSSDERHRVEFAKGYKKELSLRSGKELWKGAKSKLCTQHRVMRKQCVMPAG